MRGTKMPGRIPIFRAVLLRSAWCAACLALLTCTPPNFDDDPVPTGKPLTLSPLQPELTAGMSFTFTAAGGTSPYVFSVEGDGTITSAGKYTAPEFPPADRSDTVRVTDNEGDTASTVVTVNPSQLWVIPADVTIPANTSITFYGHGGMGSYTYSKTGVGNINPLTGVYSSSTGGDATILVTDGASVVVTTTVHVEYPVIPLAISPSAAVIEKDVEITFSASGGTGPYTFSNTGVGSINSSSGLYSSGAAGTATVKVMDGNNDTATATVTVNAPPPPLTISPSSATVVINGTQEFLAAGGTPPYTFAVESGGASGTLTGSGTSRTYHAPAATGTDTITLTDSKSRTATADVTVLPQPQGLTITPPAISVTVNGSVGLTASAGVSPYSWTIMGDGGVTPTSGSTVTYTALATEGSATVTVTDSELATANCIITINPKPLQITPTTITMQVGNSVDFDASDGTPSYDFSIAAGVGIINNLSGYFTATEESSVIVRVTDQHGRTQDAAVTVNALPLVLSPSSISIQAGSSVTFSAEGGSTPYVYSVVPDGVGSINSSTGLYTSTEAGSATIKVTDGKSRSDTASVTVDPPPAPPLDLSPVTVNVQTGTDQTFAATGGATPYQWSVVEGLTGGTITSSGVYTAPSSVPSSPTAYTVKVKDDEDTECTATVNVYAPLVFASPPTSIDAGAQFDFDATGGIAPYHFSMPTGGRGTINADTGVYTAPSTAGSDTVRVTDDQEKSTDCTFTVVDPASWGARQAIDSSSPKKSGQYASLALDESGNAQIVYWEDKENKLKLAKWTGSWTLSTIDTNSSDDKYASLALSSGNARVAWYDAGSKDLRYREWNGTTWDSTQNVDTSGDVGQYASLALDGSGNPRVAYYDATNSNLKYAKWNGSSWNASTVESTDNVGQYASLALDGSGNPRIAYYDVTHGWLKYIEYNGSSWGTVQVVDSSGNVGQYTSLKLDSSGHPRIAYYDATNLNLKYAEWDGSSWSTETVDSTGDVGQYASLALNASGDPRIAYYDATTTPVSKLDLKYASRTGTVWVVGTVDSSGNVGQYASIALAPSTYLMRIAYYEPNAHDLYFIQELP